MTRFEFEIEENFHRKRLDEFLFNEFESLSKAYLRSVVRDDLCEVNGFAVNIGIKLRKNDFVEVVVDLDLAKAMKAEKISLDIVFEDSEIIVLNKPTGILVHPTHRERNGTLLNGLIYYLNLESINNLFIRPHLIHRLDRETSGLILVAKNAKATGILSSHIKKKLFEKKYLALVEGVVENNSGEINASIGRDEIERRWKVIEGEKISQSKYKVLERLEDRTLLELEPVTGRTNQLRIHCNYIGHPIIGDKMHTENEFPRLCLHASKLGFWHPNSGERLEFENELPKDFFV